MWVIDLLATIVVGAILVGFLMGRRPSKDTRLRLETLKHGQIIQVPASLHGRRPFPRRWRAGALFLGTGAFPFWTPKFSIRRTPIEIRPPVRVEGVRDVKGVREAWSVNPACQIIRATGPDLFFELAVLPDDFEAVRSALTSGDHDSSM